MNKKPNLNQIKNISRIYNNHMKSPLHIVDLGAKKDLKTLDVKIIIKITLVFTLQKVHDDTSQSLHLIP